MSSARVQVHRRADVGADRGRGQVDGGDAGLGVTRRVREMGLGTRRLEDDIGKRILGQQPVDARGTRLQAHPRCPGQAVGRRVDPHHVRRLDQFAVA